MDFFVIFKIITIIGILIGCYAVFRNLDMIRIIIIYLKDKLLDK